MPQSGRPKDMKDSWEPGRAFLISREVGARPPPRRGLGPLHRKQKQTRFLTVTPPLQHIRCAAGEKFAVSTLKIMCLLSILASRAYSRTPRMIQSRDLGFEPNYGNLVIKILFFFSTGTGSEGWAPRPPTVFCFLFSPPAHYP